MDCFYCCYKPQHPDFKMKTRIMGKVSFSQPVQLYEIENKHGMQLSVMTFGARIVGLKVPDANGHLVDVVRGLATLEDYQKDEFYFGAVVGRVAGRISPSTVTIEGKSHNLIPNTQNVHMNGGKNGFDTAIWSAEPIEESEKHGISAIRFRYVSPDGSEGYPGELVTEVEYRLTNDNELIIKIKCSTEEDTIVSIPVHAYFNLGGEPIYGTLSITTVTESNLFKGISYSRISQTEPNIYDHSLTILADSYTPADEEWIPTGEIVSVAGTPYDFRDGKLLGEAMAAHEGYDDYWCLAQMPSLKPSLAAKLYSPKTGINMDVLTTCPGITVYTGNMLSKNTIGKYGEVNGRHSAICFEPQNYPNAINVPAFPPCVLKKGATLEHTNIFRFSKQRTKSSSVHAVRN